MEWMCMNMVESERRLNACKNKITFSTVGGDKNDKTYYISINNDLFCVGWRMMMSIYCFVFALILNLCFHFCFTPIGLYINSSVNAFLLYPLPFLYSLYFPFSTISCVESYISKVPFELNIRPRTRGRDTTKIQTKTIT